MPGKTPSGFSLVETLIGISLMGVILVPMLFISSSYFLNQLNQTRQSMEVSHNSSQFLNRFMEQLYQATRVFSTSDSTHLYFSYYDAVSQREIKEGYQLTTLGSNRILERLVYNTNSNNWDVLSPYSETEAEKLLLPNTAIFTYCQNSAASCTASSAQNALMVRLTGWNFKNASNTQTLNLPDVDVYVAAGASASDGVLLSEAPKEMYNVNAANAFGSNADLTLFNLSPYTGQLNDVSTAAAGGTGVLSTILSATDDAYYSMKVSSDGRLYTGAAWAQNSGRFITYHPSTGVTTIVNSVAGPGNYYATQVSPVDGRVYFSASGGSCKMWTWHPSTGLTTILTTNENWPGSAAMAVASDGRLYAGGDGGKFWSWKAGSGLTTLNLGTGTWAFTGTYLNVATSPLDNRVYFTARNLVTTSPSNVYNWNYFTWDPASGSANATPILTLASASTWIRQHMLVNPVTGGVYMGDSKSNDSHMYYWEPAMGTNITTINTSTSNKYVGYMNAMAVAADGRVFFGENGNNGRYFWSWKPGAALTTIYTGAADTKPGYGFVGATPGGTVFFGDGDITQTYDHIRTGAIGTTITTVPFWTGQDIGFGHKPAAHDTHIQGQAFIVRSDGRIFFTDGNNVANKSGMWTWAVGTGLTTIYMNPNVDGYPGHTAMVSDDNGRLYFTADSRDLAGDTSGALPMFTWHESTGLSTIIGANDDVFGTYGQMAAIPGSTGGVYFMGMGDIVSHGYPIWRWTPGTPSYSIKRSMELGVPNSKTINLNMSGGTYVASVQDSDGNLFYADSVNKTVDRYISSTSSGTITYSRSSQFNWTTWASSVAAIAVDENSSKIALLDSGNKEVDVYANRLATGTPAAPSSFSVASQVTLPTGLAQSNRTGNYLVIDSTMLGSNPTKYVKLYIYSSAGAYLRSYNIIVGNGTGGLAVDASAETNFKIALDSRRNILYLASPAVGRIFALSMPEYL